MIIRKRNEKKKEKRFNSDRLNQNYLFCPMSSFLLENSFRKSIESFEESDEHDLLELFRSMMDVDLSVDLQSNRFQVDRIVASVVEYYLSFVQQRVRLSDLVEVRRNFELYFLIQFEFVEFSD